MMLSRTEGFGLAAVEGLSAGLPVLVSGIGKGGTLWLTPVSYTHLTLPTKLEV